MENLRKLNLPINERLKQEAAKLEEDLIRTETKRLRDRGTAVGGLRLAPRHDKKELRAGRGA